MFLVMPLLPLIQDTSLQWVVAIAEVVQYNEEMAECAYQCSIAAGRACANIIRKQKKVAQNWAL